LTTVNVDILAISGCQTKHFTCL